MLHRLHSGFAAMFSSHTDVKVHPETKEPTKCWQKLAVKQKVDKVAPLSHDTPIYPDKLRVVCISDTHTQIEKVPHLVPPGDVLLHGGDFTNVGLAKDVKNFNDFLAGQPHPVKVIIAGNHDMTLDDELVNNRRDYIRKQFGISDKGFEEQLEIYGVKTCKELLTACVYLEDAELDVCGVKIYGSPWQPEFCDWGFNLARGEPCLEKWRLIPDHTDILITHGPPIGHGDMCFDGQRVGCVELLSTIQQRVKPKYHVFGHIHEGYGITTDGTTSYINASTCTLRYKPEHPPLIFDFPIPNGHSKDELKDIKPCRLVRNHKTGEIQKT